MTVRHEIDLSKLAVTKEVAEWFEASGIRCTSVSVDGQPFIVPLFVLHLHSATDALVPA
jgi:hypothetical protein